jgi:pimeloyl-ACP methyl ester carboxylesterase
MVLTQPDSSDSAPGAFVASISWYRTSSSNPVTAFATETKPSPVERLAIPATVLWQDHDPIFPFEWSDQLHAYFQDYTLERLSGIGHFTPLEATDRFAEAIKQRLRYSDADRGQGIVSTSGEAKAALANGGR